MHAMKFAALAATLALTNAVDWEEWKENKQDRTLTARKQALYTGTAEDLDACISEVEGTAGAEIVAFHNNSKACFLYSDFNITDEDITKESAEGEFAMYFESPEEEEDDSLSTAGIIVTCILVPLFLVCLVTCAILCKSEGSDISAQLNRLEAKELAKEEAVSEEWERRSQEAETEAKKEAAPAPEQ